MTVIVDYGVGNLFSLKSSLSSIGFASVISGDAAVISSADRVLLPGVGAFEDARRKLSETGLDKIVKTEAQKGKPLLGICLGMQLLFDRSFEHGTFEGLGLIKGEIRPIAPLLPDGFKVPHTGWNSLHFTNEGKRSLLLKHISEGSFVYFVHSFAAFDCEKSQIALTDYSIPLTAAVESGNVWGTQFHPEKSGDIGLSILRAFCEIN